VGDAMPVLSDLAHGFNGLPWQYLAVSLGLCLGLSALGFKRVVYFVSLGYAASIAAQAIVMPLLYRNTLRDWVLVQSALLLVYGLRLGTFVSLRERTASYRKEQAENAERSARVHGPMKGAIWVGVSILYVLMFLPALLTVSAQAAGLALPSTPIGVTLMVAGLGLEACADWQKSRFKKQNPSRFCDVGLYRVIRFPNYFGEMVFWFGVWISAMSAYRSPLAWMLGGLGFVCIELVMLGSSRRLELKQTGRYGADATYQAYARQTPILFPLVPLCSLRNLKVLPG
jgi:steroid 5-alpha reductase family enzyme